MKKKPKKKLPEATPRPWPVKEHCSRCGGAMEDGELDEDNTRCMSCNQDDADYIDSTMELD